MSTATRTDPLTLDFLEVPFAPESPTDAEFAMFDDGRLVIRVGEKSIALKQDHAVRLGRFLSCFTDRS